MTRLQTTALALALLAGAAAATPASAADKTEPGVVVAAESDLYRDPTATSVAHVMQVLPNSKESSTLLNAVERVSIRHDVMVIVHSGGAVTLIPRTYVSSIAINRRREAKE